MVRRFLLDTGLNQLEIAFAVALFVATCAGSIAAVALVLTRLPADYFLAAVPPPSPIRSPALRVLAAVAKNVLGALLVVAGAIMTIPGVPGQGMLTILIGLLLLDFPGKRNIERKIVRQPRILRSVNRIRKRFGREPFVVDIDGGH